jgi:hypothetical protein
MMKSKLNKQPRWAQRALQGVAYWMGHRRCLYRDYPLSEGALVVEVCNLIYANLPKDLQLLCEVQYSSLVNSDLLPEMFQRKTRADLVVAEIPARSGDEPIPKYIIEVKRASASKSQINADLSRLAGARRLRPEIRAFLFVISEANRPKRFVHEEGHSLNGKHAIPSTDGYYRVRRTWKAAHAFKKRDRAQYACLIEVYPGQTSGRSTMTGERATMQLIRQAMRQGRLKEPVGGADLNRVLGITWGGNFLAKHCLGTGSSTARFVRVSRGLYRLKV